MIGPDDTESHPRDRSIARASGRWLLPPFILGALIALVWSVNSGWPRPIVSLDVNQNRLNTAVQAPQGNSRIRQTFIPQHDGLTEIELLLIRYEYDNEAADSNGYVRFTLLNKDGQLITTRTEETKQIVHNQTYLLRFPPQHDSAGQEYTIVLEGNDNNIVSAWGYDLDVYEDGTLEINGEPSEASDLRFITRYQLTFLAGAVLTLKMLLDNLALMALVVLFLLLPGSILLIVSRRWLYRWHFGVWLGAAFALGASSWAIMWLWLSLIGARWRPWSLWAIFIIGWFFVLGWLVRSAIQRRNDLEPFFNFPKIPRRRSSDRVISDQEPTPLPGSAGLRPSTKTYNESHDENLNPGSNLDDNDGYQGYSRNLKHFMPGLILLLVVFLGLSVRLLAIRDLAFPPWVDSSRHALITTLMAETGQFPSDYRPLLPVDRTPYHYGFHTISASLALMTGQSIPHLLLIVGQLLNALVPLTVFAGAYLFTRRNSTSLLAGFLVAIPFFFPGYYVTWGRMTQLTAVMILPIAMAVTWGVIRGTRSMSKQWPFVGLLAAGLFLIHFRVFLLFIPFVALVLILSLGRHWRWILAATALALVLVAPRIFQLFSDFSSFPLISSPSSYNDFPVGYMAPGWETAFLILGAVTFFIALLAGIKKQSWAVIPITLTLWVGLVAVLLSGQRLGLPETWLLNINSAYIVLFLPLALILSIVTVKVWNWLSMRHWSIRIALWAATGAMLTLALLQGINQQVSILNPDTILANEADAKGLNWLATYSEEESMVAVSSWNWLGSTWAGSDGGAWILPVTGRSITTPPVDYIYDSTLRRRVAAFNEDISQIDDWSDPQAVARLKDEGVDLIYVGSRGGFFDPSELYRNPELKLLYSQDGVLIFSLN